MKLERVEAKLNIKNNYEYVTVMKRNGYEDSNRLLEYLRQGIRKKEITYGNKIKTNEYTKYAFNVYTYDEETQKNIKSLFVLKVRNSEKKLHFQTLKSLDDLCELSIQIKKKNVTRIVAGITAGLFILVSAGPCIAKGLKKLSDKEYEYDQQRYSQSFKNDASESLTPQQMNEVLNRYYIDLEKRAMAGDKEAIEEYNQYKLDQQLQYEEENSKVK